MLDSGVDPGAAPPGRVPSDEAEGRIDRLLRSAFEGGIRTYGPLHLAYARFSTRVLELTLRRLRACGADPIPIRVEETLARAARPDLFLAIACEEGVAGAWEAFSEHFLPRLRSLARSCGARDYEAEEIVRELPGDLVASPGGSGARTRLGAYDGTASLFTWLAVMVSRRVADRYRALGAPSRPGAVSADTALAEVPDRTAAGTDPSEAAIDEETASRLGEVLEQAWRGLDRRSVQAVVLKFRDGLTQREIARRLGISDAQVSRIVASALENIRTAVQEKLRSDFPDRWHDEASAWNTLRKAVTVHLQSAGPAPEHLPRRPAADEPAEPV